MLILIIQSYLVYIFFLGGRGVGLGGSKDSHCLTTLGIVWMLITLFDCISIWMMLPNMMTIEKLWSDGQRFELTVYNKIPITVRIESEYSYMYLCTKRQFVHAMPCIPIMFVHMLVWRKKIREQFWKFATDILIIIK